MDAIVRFAFGAFGGAVVSYLGCNLFFLMVNGPPDVAAIERGQTQAEYERDFEWRYQPRVLALTIFGGLAGGACAALLGAAPISRPRRRRPNRSSSTQLSDLELERVLASCAWVDFAGKSPDYVQGVIVGRLAESDAALAKRIDALDEATMAALAYRLQRKKSL